MGKKELLNNFANQSKSIAAQTQNRQMDKLFTLIGALESTILAQATTITNLQNTITNLQNTITNLQNYSKPSIISLTASQDGIYLYDFINNFDWNNFIYKFAFINANGLAMETPWCSDKFALNNYGLRSPIYWRNNAGNTTSYNGFFSIQQDRLRSYLDNELWNTSTITLYVFKRPKSAQAFIDSFELQLEEEGI